jgi:phosphohistidine phosphatase
MKTLYIVRHAKSSWANPSQDDFDRPLNDRGKRDAPDMAKRLKEKKIKADVILSSPARRALSTAKRFAGELNFPKDKIKTKEKLYHAHEDTILEAIKGIKDKHNVAIVVGHNPGLTDFVNSFQKEEFDIDNLPTCAVVAFEIAIDSWKDAAWGKGKIVFFDYPKNKED